MEYLYRVLLVIHIASAALVFGAGTGLVRNLKRTSTLGKESFVAATEDAARRGAITSFASVTTLLTGLALIFTIGGFAAVPLNIHIALTIMIAAIGVSATVTKPNTQKLVQLARTEPLDEKETMATLRKLAMGTGIAHLMWLTILTLMIVRISR